MATSSRQKVGFRTELSDFVRDERRKHLGEDGVPLSQQKYQEDVLAFTERRQYVSKIESGIIRQPSSKFLELLSEKTGVSVEQLWVMSQRPVKRQEIAKKFRLGFGHCMWAVPVFIAAYDGHLPNVSAKSFKLKDEFDPWDYSRGTWIQPKQTDFRSPKRMATEIISLSAADILDALRDDTIDIAVIPWEAIPEGESQFLKLGTIVDSSTGCTFVYREPKNSSYDLNGTQELGKFLVEQYKTVKSKHGIRVAVEEGTVALAYLKDALLHTMADLNGATVLTAEEVKWHVPNTKLTDADFQLLEQQCREENHGAELLGVITWEPHATWLKKNTDEKDTQGSRSVTCVSMHFTPREADAEKRLTFDIIVRDRPEEDPEKYDALRQALWQLMLELARCVRRIRSWRHVEDEPGVLKLIARYFGLLEDGRNEAHDIRETLRIIKEITFTMDCDPDALDRMNFMTDSMGVK